MINNIPKNEIRKLDSIISTVYEPVEGWSYSHHAHITRFQGRFYAIWSNGRRNEDDCGQRVMLTESVDGEVWENLRSIVTPERLGDPLLVLMAAGFYIDGETLNLYYGYYRYKEQFMENGMRKPGVGDTGHENTGMGYLYTTDGSTWSDPVDMNIPLVPNHGPQKTASGRIIISGNIMFPYTDNSNGVEDYQITGIYGDAFNSERLRDDSESIQYVTKYNGWDTRLICEGSFFQTDDGVIHMLLRSGGKTMWCTDSFDDGETWTAPYNTEYTEDFGGKFHFGRLADGRFYGVSNGLIDGWRRNLILCLSKDGENFDESYIVRDEPHEMKFPGMHKEAIYGYPHTLVHEGYMYIIYSKSKEGVEVTKLSLEQLS